MAEKNHLKKIYFREKLAKKVGSKKFHPKKFVPAKIAQKISSEKFHPIKFVPKKIHAKNLSPKKLAKKVGTEKNRWGRGAIKGLSWVLGELLGDLSDCGYLSPVSGGRRTLIVDGTVIEGLSLLGMCEFLC